jgi:hypothetical protein
MISPGRPSSEFPLAGKAPLIENFALRLHPLARRFSAFAPGNGFRA